MAAFDDLVAALDYPMLVVTTAAGERRAGCLVGFASQCSIDPARYAVLISKRNHTYEVACDASWVVVHVPREDDVEIARLFGEQTGDDVDKFARCEWTPGPGDVPVIAGLDWFAGRVHDRIDTGDHVAFVLDVAAEGSAERAREPAVGFQLARRFDPGHNA